MPADIFTLKNIAVVCGIALLLLLGHFFPRRRIYAIFLALLAGAGAAFSFFTPETSEPITPAERQVRAVQQQLVAAWHAKHQKAIDALDHNWKQYHLVLSDFAAEAISLEEAQSRLERIDRNQTETVNPL